MTDKRRSKVTGTPGKYTVLRYANRKLYDPKTSDYVSSEQLFEMVRKEVDFEVIDTRDGSPYTMQVMCSMLYHLSRQGISIPLPLLLAALRAAVRDAAAS